MSTPGEREGSNRSPRRRARPITVTGLETAAAAYVARYDASSARLRAVLMRRVLKARRDEASVIPEVEAVIEGILARYAAAGILDDGRYAERKAGRLHQRGVSRRHIREKLKLAGIGRDAIEQALETARGETAGRGADMDLQAALAFASRRRLGPFRAPAQRRERRNRDLAALGRAGFDLDIARRVIDTDDPDTLLAPETPS